VAIEFKTKTGRQSQVQKDWQRAFEMRGGKYFVVRNETEMKDAIWLVQNGC